MGEACWDDYAALARYWKRLNWATVGLGAALDQMGAATRDSIATVERMRLDARPTPAEGG